MLRACWAAVKGAESPFYDVFSFIAAKHDWPKKTISMKV